MSKEWFEAAERMLAAEIKDLDVVVGTALIPGRPAPRLVTEVSWIERAVTQRWGGVGSGGWGGGTRHAAEPPS